MLTAFSAIIAASSGLRGLPPLFLLLATAAEYSLMSYDYKYWLNTNIRLIFNVKMQLLLQSSFFSHLLRKFNHCYNKPYAHKHTHTHTHFSFFKKNYYLNFSNFLSVFDHSNLFKFLKFVST